MVTVSFGLIIVSPYLFYSDTTGYVNTSFTGS
jgi:hypothetical protein